MASAYPTSRSARAAPGPRPGGAFNPQGEGAFTDLLGRPFRGSTEFERLLDDIYRPRERDRSIIPNASTRRRGAPTGLPLRWLPWPRFGKPTSYPGHTFIDCGLGVPMITAGTFANPCGTVAGVIFGFPDVFYPLGGPAGNLGFAEWFWSGTVGGLPAATSTTRHVWVGPELAPSPLPITPWGKDPLLKPKQMKEGFKPGQLPILQPVDMPMPAPATGPAGGPLRGNTLEAEKPVKDQPSTWPSTAPGPGPRPVPTVTERPVQVFPQPKPEAKPLEPDHRYNVPSYGTRERKVGTRNSALVLALVNAVTESVDAVEAIYMALPKNRRWLICDGSSGETGISPFALRRHDPTRPNSSRCRRPNPAEMAERIWKYADEIDTAQAVWNLMYQGLTDRLQFNASGREYRRSGARPHGPLRVGVEVGPAI